MLASGRPLGFGAGWPGGFTQGSKRGLQLGFGCQVISRLLSLRDSFAEFIRSFFCSIYLPLEVVYLLAMGSRATNNSLQTAPLMSTPSSGDDNVANVPSMSRSGGSLEGLPAADVGGEAGISPAMVSLIAQTVRAALAAERANDSPSSLASTPPIPSVSSPSVPSTTMTASSGGVPPLLSSSTHAFLTAGAGVAGPSLPGRPIQSMYPVVPSFVSTFANPSMSVFSSTSAYDLPTDATRVVADRPAVLALPVVDQPFVVGPGFACAGQACCSNCGRQVRRLERTVGGESGAEGPGTAVVIGRPSRADFSAQEAASSYRGYRLMDGGLRHLLVDSGLQLPPSLEGFNAVPAVDPADLSPFFWQSLARLRPSVP